MCHGNLLIRQIAGRIRGPYVTAYGLGPNSEITAADVKPTAGGTASFDVLFLYFKFAQQLI